MRNWWIKFGCFLTGYNYDIMKSSSEASAKSLKKYTSAILIVSIIWAFIGFTFSNRYMHLDVLGSSIGAVIMVFIVIQIEKQIILNIGQNNVAIVFRVLIAIIMAILGSVIIDQIIFKDDIELQKEQDLILRVNKNLPGKVNEINEEIARLDSLINDKNSERTVLMTEILENPLTAFLNTETIRRPGKTNRTAIDANGISKTIQIDTVYTETKYSSSSRENPKAQLIPNIESQLVELSKKRDDYSNLKIGVKDRLEEKFRSKVGFLDELETMITILLKSNVALGVWLLWFLFLVFIELFVVSNKMFGNNDTDYDTIIKHQMAVKINAINQLSKPK
jgi:hypothetical protein